MIASILRWGGTGECFGCETFNGRYFKAVSCYRELSVLNFGIFVGHIFLTIMVFFGNNILYYIIIMLADCWRFHQRYLRLR